MESDMPAPKDDTSPAPLQRTSSTCARVTWFSFHAAGLFMLWLGGNWPSGRFLAYLTATTAVLYIAAALMDPGYLPTWLDELKHKALDPACDESPLDPSAAGGSSSKGEGACGALARPLLNLPICMHCGAAQTARAKHCYDCGRCVRRLDHHCWWLGNCVGVRNHRLFLGYLACQMALIWSIGLSAMHLVFSPSTKPWASAANHVWGWVGALATICCIALAVVLGLLSLTLFLFQLGLIARGETTWEHLRRERINAQAGLPPDVRPYDHGRARNCLAFWTGHTQQRLSVMPCAAPATPVSASPVSETPGGAMHAGTTRPNQNTELGLSRGLSAGGVAGDVHSTRPPMLSVCSPSAPPPPSSQTSRGFGL